MTAFDQPDVVALGLRVLIGMVFVIHGYNHGFGAGGLKGTASWFEGLGMRWPRVQAINSTVVEIGAGLLLIFGLLTPLASAALAATCLVAWVTAHRANGFFVFRDGYEYVLVLAVVALLLPLLGPGALSLDNALGLESLATGYPAAGASLAVAVVSAAGLLAVCWRPIPSSPATN